MIKVFGGIVDIGPTVLSIAIEKCSYMGPIRGVLSSEVTSFYGG